jgi:hypothetical protein
LIQAVSNGTAFFFSDWVTRAFAAKSPAGKDRVELKVWRLPIFWQLATWADLNLPLQDVQDGCRCTERKQEPKQASV